MRKSLLSLGLVAVLLLFTLPFDGRSQEGRAAAPALELPPALAAGSQAYCEPWVQVNADAFGLGTGADTGYSSEEGFEVLVFENRLYLGMEADNALGARLWRTKARVTTPTSQADWEEVAAPGCDALQDPANANCDPFGVPDRAQNDHIDSLAAFQGDLYASTANRGSGGGAPAGTLLFRSPSGDPGTWGNALASLGPGFGDPDNENFKDMQVFAGQLCGGTWNEVTGAQVWCSPDGTSWTQKNASGFGDPANTVIWSGQVFSNTLYFGVQNSGQNPADTSDDVARLFRTASLGGAPVWTETFTGAPGSFRADLLGELDGFLYLATRGPAGIEIYRSPTGDTGSWSQVNLAGMDGDPANAGVEVDGAALYNGALYLGVRNLSGGFELWRTTGLLQESGRVDWEPAGTAGLGDPNNVRTQLIPFNGQLYAWTTNYVTGQQVRASRCPAARNVILLVADGWGAKQIEAANHYTGEVPEYQAQWDRYCTSTYPAGGGYDPVQAWSDFSYVMSGTTDSAAAATALYTGVKTANGRITVSADGAARLLAISEKARLLDRAAGAVTSVYLSHATPGAWEAHNDARGNGFAIADEGFWGDPNTTGTPVDDSRYGGGHGPTLPPLDVLIGAGHPAWQGGSYVNQAIRDKLFAERGQPGALAFVERLAGQPDGGPRLLAVAADPAVTRLAGLFGGTGGNLEWRLADGSGADPENPTLEEMARAALTVLNRDPDGFVLMIEGGAVDWANHANRMDRMVGELIAFNYAVQAVIDWVDDPANGSSWENTLVIVTGDHESGYLTAGPGVFPDQSLGAVTTYTLGLEKTVSGTGRRASWEDGDLDDEIDPAETVYWAWNSGGHTNQLIPLYARGPGAGLFAAYLQGSDPVCGAYLDNTDVFRIMDAVVLNPLPAEYRLFFPLVFRSP